MVVSAIQSRISASDLTLKPGHSTATLDVEVVNGSDRPASFHIVLVATGDDGQQPRRWYHLSSLTSSKTPPGTRSQYTVAIVDTPLSDFVGLANITVRVISPELQAEERHILRLRVEPGAGIAAYTVDLPTQTFQDYPGQLVEIPARVYNSRRNPMSVIVSCPGVETWLADTSPTTLRLLPNRWHDIVLTCQIPEELSLSRSQEYPFQVLVVDDDGDAATAPGVLEVLPLGYFELVAEQTTLTIPASPRWLPDRQANSTQTQFRLENHSNLRDTLRLDALPSDQADKEAKDRNCAVTVAPETLRLDPGQGDAVEITVQVDRPWLGWIRILLIHIQARLQDGRLELRNDTETLQIRVAPVIPCWLQVLAILLFLGAIAGLGIFQAYRQHHRQLVSAVQFNGIGARVISGSSDQTIRQWQVRPRRLRPSGKAIQLDKAVRVLRYRPVDNNQIIVGLENGQIQLWDLLKQPSQPLETLVNQTKQQSDLDDRVMALATTQDARHLFSGHGSGHIYQWYIGPDRAARTLASQQPTNQIFIPELAIYDVALVGADDRALAIAGRYNKLLLWDWSQESAQNSTELAQMAIADQTENAGLIPIDYPSGGQDDYITSLATVEQNPFRLATADNQGQIMVWDLTDCLEQTGPCSVIDQWRLTPDTAIRDIALSANGCYLVSASDDGRITLWPLTKQGRRLTRHLNGKPVKQINTGFNSVDIKLVESDILIVSGAEDHRVRLHRLRNSAQACQG